MKTTAKNQNYHKTNRMSTEDERGMVPRELCKNFQSRPLKKKEKRQRRKKNQL